MFLRLNIRIAVYTLSVAQTVFEFVCISQSGFGKLFIQESNDFFSYWIFIYFLFHAYWLWQHHHIELCLSVCWTMLIMTPQPSFNVLCN